MDAVNGATTNDAVTQILREGASTFERIRQRREIGSLVVRSLAWSAACAAIFGASLGTYPGTAEQIAASAIKVPLLLLGAMVVCFPTFHALQAWRAVTPMSLMQSLALQSSVSSVVGLLWASFGLPLLFLLRTAHDYRLAQSLALVVGALGGLVGLGRLLAGYRTLCDGADARSGRDAMVVYVLTYGLVGLQLSWMLRPIIGSPGLPFQLFRAEQGSVFSHLLSLLGL